MNKKGVLFWLVFGLSALTILCGILIICMPSLYWSFMNFILGALLILLGFAAIGNAISHFGSNLTWLLIFIGFFSILFGFLIMFSTQHCSNEGLDDLGEPVNESCDSGGFLGTLIMWLFALWAIIRGSMLTYFGMTGRGAQKYRLLEIILGIILVILGFFTVFNTNLGTRIAGVCMGISILFDGIFLSFLSFRILASDDVQVELIAAASQSEIAQGEISNDGTNTNISQPTQPVQQTGTQEQITPQQSQDIQQSQEQNQIISQPAQEVTNTDGSTQTQESTNNNGTTTINLDSLTNNN